MISVSDLSVVFGDQVLFKDLSLFVREQDRIGLVGRNGAGKSTLLKILCGLQVPSTGTVNVPKGVTLGYLRQELNLNSEVTVLEEAGTAFATINELEKNIDRITVELTERDDYESQAYHDLIQELNDSNDRLHILGVGNTEENISRILTGLGFEQEEFHRPMNTFSGGWQMRVELAKLLLRNPDVLLLDEPTNHLDIISIQWLESFLKVYPGAIILISHDRAFLDNLTKRTIELSNRRGYDYKLGYSKYLVAREMEREKQVQAYKNQQKYIEDTQELINKFRAKKNKAAFAQTLIKKLDKLERIEVDEGESGNMRLRFPPAPRSGKISLEAHKLTKRFGDKVIFRGLEAMIPRGEKLAVVGKNGVGKTTFLRSVCGLEECEGEFKIGHNVEIGYFAQNQAESLNPDLTVFDTIDEVAVGDIRTQIRGLLGSFLFSGDDIHKKVKVLSGGEKCRLALCKLLLKPYNLLILDEPTNHLDIRSKEVLKEALLAYDGTMIIVSHDRDFLDGLVKSIYEVTPTGLKQHLGTIYEFLRDKDAESIAHFEMSQSKPTKSIEEPKPQAGSKQEYEERKERTKEIRRLKNKVSNCEKQIAEMESRVQELDKVIAGLDYSNEAQSAKILSEYGKLKEQLENVMYTWEESENQLAALKLDDES
jgi:ATP-binding cassette, subfamily F, member 3